MILGIKVSDSQIHRLTNDYGSQVELLLEQEGPKWELSSEDFVYGEIDGSMLFTRESAWQEMKLGRIFKSEDRVPVNKERNLVHRSEYMAHLGDHSSFEQKMSLLLDKYEDLDERLIFISDGAPWIANYIKAQYPKATMILDVFHAKEYLSQFLEDYFGKEGHKQRYSLWAKSLVEQGALPLIEQIEKLPKTTKKAEKAQEKILKYYRNNAYRMKYPLYLKKGMQIGSGAIEAAHRTVAQCRLKRSGQRWSKKGAQNVLNLRVLNMSGRWNELQNLLKAA